MYSSLQPKFVVILYNMGEKKWKKQYVKYNRDLINIVTYK